jgi:hypothetical protein
MQNKREILKKYMSLDLQPQLDRIKSIVSASGTPLEGNCFYHHNTFDEFDDLVLKQTNLYWCGGLGNHICEIGFNAGHSALLLLSGHDKKKTIFFTVVDTGGHQYTAPCLNYIRSEFPNAIIDYIQGDSTVEIPKKMRFLEDIYDVVHVDGGHSQHCVTTDLDSASKLVKKGGIIIVDDTNFTHISDTLDEFLLENPNFSEISIFPTLGYQHRIIQKSI